MNKATPFANERAAVVDRLGQRVLVGDQLRPEGMKHAQATVAEIRGAGDQTRVVLRWIGTEDAFELSAAEFRASRWIRVGTRE